MPDLLARYLAQEIINSQTEARGREAKALTSAEEAVLSYLDKHSSPTRWPTVQQISKATRLTPDKVTTCLRRLRIGGLVQQEGGGANGWVITNSGQALIQ